MKKSIFTNVVFYWAIVSILGVLLLWNLYLTIAHSRLAGLLPISIQATLLVLIFKRHEYAKNGIKIWAIIFLIASSGLQLFGRLLKDLSDSFTNVDLQHYLTTGITIIVGILIVNYTNKTVEVVEIIKEETEPNHN
ncbi:hypothetical protein I2I11_11890 [Pontibacter sp. 172403-2]|uniref:hypothetical protein n=1 Tax=Pontibacter rufus TaxID=2791028 RepID=UPI0018AFFBEB|nr:hypothetical protein [Pontibacter sp. 172403-2]MBF9253995.1 hypothetical protein [Pontibacter sp. 172403-2]